MQNNTNHQSLITNHYPLITLNNNYSTTRLCYKLIDDEYVDKNGKIKEEYKFKLNFPEFGIRDSKIPAKEDEKFDTLLFLPEGEDRKWEGGLRTKGYFKFFYKLVNSEELLVNSEKKDDNSWWIIGHDNKLIKQVTLPPITNHQSLPTTYYPLITIVTVVYNGEKCLEETIQSVINQTYPNVEYIIIDGSSTDGTLDIIRKYEDYIDYWVSEKDNGIYDAMNKGIKVATGTWVNFMNAGDVFASKNVLSTIDWNKYFNYVLIYGKKIQNGKVVLPLPLKMLEVGEIHANHQSMFFNYSILKNELYYDVKYKIYSDYELVNKIYLKYQDRIKYIDKIIANFEGGGISSKVTFQKRKDKYLILYKYYGLKGLIKGIMYRIRKFF